MGLLSTVGRVAAAYFTGGGSELVKAGADALSSMDAHKADDSAYAQSIRNEQLQREFAQHGIRWKVEDAKAAGLHPLAALGAQTMGYSPSSFGGDSGSYMASQGQDISRMINAGMTAGERNDSKLAAALNLEHMELQNDLLRSQIAKMNSAQLPPAFPNPGIDPGTPGVKMKPAEVTASARDNPAREAGAVNDYGFARTETGLVVIPSTDVKERIEDQIVPEAMWAFRNNVLPALTGVQPPSTKDFPLPEGMYWKWNPLKQEFQPARKPSFESEFPTPKNKDLYRKLYNR